MAPGELLGLVGGVIRLDPEAMRTIAQSPDGLRLAVTILLLSSFSDAVGNSPVLFLSGVGGGRFAVCLLVDTLLSLVRVAVWIASVALLLSRLTAVEVSPAEATLVVGIGFTPMLFSFLGLLPLLGPVLLRLLHAWVIVTTIVALRALYGLELGQALAVAGAGWVVVLAIGHTVDRAVVRGFGRLTRRLLGVDLLLRFGQVDLVDQVVAAGPLPGPPGRPSSGSTEARP
jgi:hypothetical protein